MVPRTVKKRSFWSKGRVILASLGLSAGALISGFSYAGRFAEEKFVRPYIVDICKGQFDSLITPLSKSHCALVYDTKLTRFIIEDMAASEVVERAKNKMNDTTWKVK